MKQIAVAVALLGLVGCATTNPQEAAGIYYHLPRTDAKVTLALDVTACAPDLNVTSTLKIDPVAGAQDALWRVGGRDLASGVTKRGLTIDVDDNGVVSSVNATATDQQAVILGAAIKIAATVAPFAARAGATPVLQCNDATKKNLVRLVTVQKQLDAARSKLGSDSDPAGVQKEIDALAGQLVATKTALHQETTATLKLEKDLKRGGTTDKNGAVLDFDLKPLASIFDTAYVGPSKLDTVHGVNDDTKDAFKVVGYYMDTAAAANGLGGSLPGEPEACKQWMTLPAARIVRVALDRPGTIVAGPIVTGPADTPSKEVAQTMPASQLGDNAKLCLSAAFGENRTVGLKFDKFGRTTEFAWTADARAANVASALAGAAPDAATLATTLRGRDLAADKKELDQLTTEQSLKKARACQALLDEGASSCPSS